MESILEIIGIFFEVTAHSIADAARFIIRRRKTTNFRW